MTFYQSSIIYKLLKKDDFNNENIYIGSTCNFKNRKCRHKFNTCSEKSKNYNMFLYDYIRNNGGFDDWTMIQIENFKCDTKKELEARERYWIELLKPKLNSRVPTRTLKECKMDNIERYKSYNKQYVQKNKEIIAKKGKKWREDNKEVIKEQRKKYYETNKELILKKQQEYGQKNKEIIAEKRKEYRNNNKEILLEKKKIYSSAKVICDHCSGEYRRDYLNSHKKTKKCINSTKD